MPEDVPTAPPKDVQVLNITSTTVTITWEEPDIEFHNGVIRHYHITASPITHNFEPLSTTTSEKTLQIVGLHPFTTYALSVAAFTIDLGPASENTTITTMEDLPTGPPLSVGAEPINSTAIHVYWDPPLPTQANGLLLNYIVLVSLEAEPAISHRYEGNSEAAIVGSLQPFTTYTVSIAFENSVGIGPFSYPHLVQTMEDAPGAPENLHFSNLTSSSVVLYWENPPANEHNGIIRFYEIIISDNQTNFSINYTAMDTKYTLAGLHPYYWYIFQVSAVTIRTGEPSSQLILRTLEDYPSGPPVNLLAYVYNSTHVDITWDNPEPGQQNGIITHYDMKLTELNSLTTQTQLIVNSMSTTLSDLHPSYTYQLQVAAANSVGFGPYSTVHTFTMDEAAPSSPPQNFSVEVVDSTSILLTWEPPAFSEQNGQIRSYSVAVFDEVLQVEMVFTVASEHNQFLVDMLHPYRSYDCRIAATTVATGPYSTAITITTHEDVPSEAPSSVNVSAINSTSILVVWNLLPEDAQNGIILHYTVTVLEIVSGRVTTYSENITYMVISFLHPHYVYEVSVAALTRAGTGPFSSGLSVTTHSDVPTGPPQNVEIQSISATSVSIAWSAPKFDMQNGDIFAYVIFIVGEKAHHKQTINSTESYISGVTLSSLEPFSQYNLSIAAVNVNGSGPYSSPLPFETAHAAPSEAPVGLRAETVTSRIITLVWEAPPLLTHNGIIQEYILSVVEIVTKSTITYKSQSPKMTLQHLHPYYTYQISVAAVTVDIGPYSAITVTTLEEAPSGPPQHFSVVLVTSTNVSLMWEPPIIQQQNGLIRGYSVSICNQRFDNCWSELSADTHYTITGLHPFYKYNINIAAVTIETGPSTAYKSVTCLEDAPSGPPVNVTVHEVTSTSLHLVWSEPAAENRNGIIRLYVVIVMSVFDGHTHNYSVHGSKLALVSLKPFTDYECSVAASTIELGPFSSPVLIKTLEDAPSGSPVNISVAILDSTRVNVSWSPPLKSLQNGNIQYYILYIYGTNGSSRKDVNDLYILIEQLHPHYTYEVTVAAVTIIAGPFSEASEFSMPQAAPSSGPQILKSASYSPYNIELHWEAPSIEDQNGDIISYFINITHSPSGEGQLFTVPGNSSYFSESSFHPYYTYSVSVHAVTVAVGPGTVVSVTTLETVPSSPPLDVMAVALSPTVANLSWHPPALENRNGLIREYSIIRVTLPIGDLHHFWTHAQHILFTDLHPYTNYFFVVAAKTVSLGPFSQQVFLDMPESGPSGRLQNITLSVQSPNSVVMRWLPPPLHTWNGVIQNYTIYIEYIEPVSPSGKVNMSQEMHNLSFTQVHPASEESLANNRDPHLVSLPLQFESVIVSNLQECQVYQFTIAMANSVGWGQRSLPIIQELPGSEPSGAPVNIQVHILSSSSVEVQWDPPGSLHHNGIINQYWVEVTEWMNPAHVVFNDNTTEISIIIDGLEGFTDYQVRVTAENPEGRGPASNPIHFKTPEDVPSEPVNMTVSQVGIADVSVSWTLPLHPNGVIISYTVWYASVGKDKKQGYSQIVVVDAQYTTATVANLSIGSAYSFKVRAKTSAGFGKYSKNVSIVIDPNFSLGNVSKSHSRDSAGVIVASLVAINGFIAAVILIVVGVYFWYKCRRTKKDSNARGLAIPREDVQQLKLEPDSLADEKSDNFQGDVTVNNEGSTSL